jgi:OPA family sugar phosphate sensor protein UhpC-like MFS transporter
VCFVQAKGVADAGSAAFRVSGLELGGLFGSLLAGRISDALIARDPKGGNCGKRVQVRPLSSCAAARMTSQAGPSGNDPFALLGWLAQMHDVCGHRHMD